jgi:hypothetical protein
MDARYLILIIAGLAMTVWGFPASYRLSKPWHILGALAALAGVVGTLAGILLLTVPGFLNR